ncbi:MAG: hypothetical protein HY898_32495 [Deltaproteobacteria bacterium]|nr:hypothetical protein [Deltaproteobacteria bacterium]
MASNCLFRAVLVASLVACNAGCARAETTVVKDWASVVGQRVVVDGTAANAKLGAMLETSAGVVWIDGLDSWPEGFYEGQGKGKRLRVTGVVVERHDLPVFVKKPGEPEMQGIPVSPGTDLDHASKRYLLQNATWEPGR